MRLSFFFLLSLSDSSQLVYRKATYFCILILYPGNLLNLFRSSKALWWRILVFLYIVLSSTNNDSFTYSLPIWMSFISCLIAVARTSNTMLNRRGKSGHRGNLPQHNKGHI